MDGRLSLQAKEDDFMNYVQKGRRGEDLATAFLLERQYHILQRNWRAKTGEIDIIAEKSGILIFCEVKSRSSLIYGAGAEAVNRQKQQRIIRTAMLYLQRFGLFERPCQFDVIEILLEAGKEPLIHHIPRAFGG
jgi:putative endonuclease